MKRSENSLGLAIQTLMLHQGLSVERLAREMGISADGLSNLMHGRRRFRDETLERLANTPSFSRAGFTLDKLKALRAADEYSLSQLILALVELVRHGAIAQLPEDFFDQLRRELEAGGFPPAHAHTKHALLELVTATRP
ncbi:MAG: helix-turn-helix transcriptional regulator [Candidatus Melainabacteria bacterium]|nr:helix-turn-helix transcriptional regulator [Candidatus Melainabacteria bacterium]